MVLFQSVAAGLGIITTKIRAAADYLKEPDNCLWVEPKNPEMLADKIAFLLKNRDISRQMSNNNKALSKIFTEDIICQEFTEIYDNLGNN
jgi:glycosyltransferase involved in cell wall biosynthesis